MKSTGTILVTVIFAAMVSACGGSGSKENSGNEEAKKNLAPPEMAKEMTFEEAQADWKNQKGIGPVTSAVELGDVDAELAKAGEKIYSVKCIACHDPKADKLGPAPVGILERRTPEWTMNMMLNPEEMVMKDPIAKGLLAKYNTMMVSQGLTQEDARAVLEYFRTL